MFIFRRKKGRTRETAPFTGIGNLIPQFLADITGDHSCISGDYRFNAQLPHSGNDLLLQCFLLPIPTVRIRSTPSFQIIHLPPCHKGRTGNKLIDLLRRISDTLQQIIPDNLHPCYTQRHIDAVHRHPVYFFLPAFPVPESHGVGIGTVIQVISILHSRRLSDFLLRQRQYFRQFLRGIIPRKMNTCHVFQVPIQARSQ